MKMPTQSHPLKAGLVALLAISHFGVASFTNTCSNVTLIDGTNASPGRKMTIEATCLTKDSVPVCSRLNFEDCYSDVNGMLIPTAAGEECYACEGRFPDSCKGCHFEKNPHHFVCECLRDDGGWSRAEVDINYVIENEDGRLHCVELGAWGSECA